MAIKVGEIKGRPARITEEPIESLGDSVLLRILPVGRWLELAKESEEATKALEEAELKGIAATEASLRPVATLLSECLTDEDQSVLSFDAALELCIAEDGLDGVQLKELTDAIQRVNGQGGSGND